ncbi:MAG: Hpt domain-containing protein [Treponema sp.]|jgi:anti-sigma regulatory factor (Ser/Thr protein kinase)/HPt (histidine-containing phosphotransfer) domain-containing protein|nr:Hpt domain-containing protein [Treponema sp.]
MVNYTLSSLVNDTVNIIRMRLAEKPIRFFTNIDGLIPNSLIGDEAKLRQILLNLLSNAVKYSEKGYIGLFIIMEKRDEKQVWLKIAVSDTGKGIKPEDQAKLFGEFTQVDIEKNRGIEGTGLGLAITKRLCLAMGGDISVESEYGSGSVFTAVIPQGIESETPFAAVEEPERKKVLIFEGRTVYAKSLAWSMENMKVPYTLVTNPGDFTNALLWGPSTERAPASVASEMRGSPLGEWFYVFSGYGLYEKIKPVMDRTEASFPDRKRPPLALTVDTGNEAYIPNVRFISLPILSLSIANILNGKEDGHGIGLPGGYDHAPQSPRQLVGGPDPQSPIPVIPGVDVQRGISMADGKMALYEQVLTLFRKDAELRLPSLTSLTLQTAPGADALPAFVTQVHALKSASASIGAAAFSAMAEKLEAAGKNGDLAFIRENLPGFAETLAGLMKGIDAAFNSDNSVTHNATPAVGSFAPLFHELAAALQSQKADDIDRILEELTRQQLSADLKTALEQISDEVLMAEYSKAGEILAGLL